MLKLKSKAPSFTLQNQDGKEISLKDFKGQKVAIYFYPRALTPGCTAQACSIRDFQKELKAAGVVVLGISTDDPKKLKKFQEKYDLNFDLLSDPEHKIIEKFGVWSPKKFMGKEFLGTQRMTFFLDEEGKVLHIMEKVKTQTHAEEILEWFNEN